MAAINLRRLLIGQEVTWGTAVVPTAKLMGVQSMSHQLNQTTYQSVKLGQIAPSSMTTIVTEDASMDYTMDASYEDILLPLTALDTPAISAPPAPTTFIFALPLDTAGVFASQTLILDQADDAGEYSIAGAIGTNIEISGEAGGIWSVAQNVIGKKLITGTTTTVPADRVVELIRMADTKLYIDLSSVAIPVTEIPAQLISFNLSLNTARHLKYFGGDVNPLAYGIGLWDGTLTLVLELTTESKALVTGAIAVPQVLRSLRIRAVSGTKSAIIDFYGYLNAGPLTLFGDRDGNTTVEFEFVGAYNVTAAKWCQISITNSLLAVP